MEKTLILCGNEAYFARERNVKVKYVSNFISMVGGQLSETQGYELYSHLSISYQISLNRISRVNILCVHTGIRFNLK